MNDIHAIRPLKVIPQNLIMSEAVPAGQRFTYLSTHSMDAMLRDDYFVSEAYRMRAGDTLRVVQVENNNISAEGNRVIAYIDLMVCAVEKSSQRQGKSIKLHREPWVDAEGRVQTGPHYIDYEAGEGGREAPAVNADSRYVQGKVKWLSPGAKWGVVTLNKAGEEVVVLQGIDEKEHAEAIASGKVPLPAKSA